MKALLLVAAVVALVAAAAWVWSRSEPVDTPYTVEVNDVAGVRALAVVPEVAVTATGHLVMPEVVARANTMPEVVVLGVPNDVRGQMLEARGQKSVQPGREEV